MTDIRFIAKQYIDAGWAVVPLRPGEKRGPSGWNAKVYTPDNFKSADNIAGKCGEPSGWRVDLDCDVPEAIEAARLLVPQTGLIHGRPGKNDSHYWFICPNIKTSQFTDVRIGDATQMLVEVRSTGGYTALPPSIHPSGETMTWTIERDPMILSAEELYELAVNIAIVAFVVRHWADLTHASMGHLAGFLLQGGVDPKRVLRLFKTIGQLAPGNYTKEIIEFCQSTIGKFEAGDRVSGGPKLAEFLGEPAVSKLRGWLKLKDTDAIETFNSTHFFVRMGKDSVIGREDDNSGPVFQQTRALYTEYANRKIVVGEDKKGKPQVKPLFQEWLESITRRSYRKVVFAPPPCVADPDDYNLWQGYAVEPAQGDCRPFLEHLRENICAGNQEHYEFLINLLALTVQEPGTPSGIATVLRGGQGTGKGVFVRTFGDLFGRRYYTQLDKVDQLAGKFNASLSGKVVVFADEAFFAGDKREVGALKRIITEPTLHIERKGIDGVDEDNHVHLFMATNNKWSWPAEIDERRGFLLKVDEARKQDAKYFSALVNSIDRPALLHHFLNHPVDRALVRNVPRTEELRAQQTKSLERHLEWWHECLTEGRIGQLGWPNTWTPCTGFYETYQNWLAAYKGRLMVRSEFGQELNTFMSADIARTRRISGDVVRCLMPRNLSDARKYWDDRFKTIGNWPKIDVDASNPTIF